MSSKVTTWRDWCGQRRKVAFYLEAKDRENCIHCTWPPMPLIVLPWPLCSVFIKSSKNKQFTFLNGLFLPTGHIEFKMSCFFHFFTRLLLRIFISWLACPTISISDHCTSTLLTQPTVKRTKTAILHSLNFQASEK